MNIQEELRINGHQSVVGCYDTDTGVIFKTLIEKYGANNIFFILSCSYNLGRVHGIREERSRKKRKPGAGGALTGGVC